MRSSFLAALAAAVLAPSLAIACAACTETPSYFPPCVDPYVGCSYDAGADVDASAPDSGNMADAADAGDAAAAPAEE